MTFQFQRDYRRWFFTILVCICLLCISLSVACKISVTVEKPTRQKPRAAFEQFGLETFDRATPRSWTRYRATFSNSNTTVFRGIYHNLKLLGRSTTGGAWGRGSYASASFENPYQLVLTKRGPSGITYFGIWISAIEPGNRIDFYRRNRQLFSLSAADVLAKIETRTDYLGNPTYSPKQCEEKYFVYVNVFFHDCRIHEVRFHTSPGSLFNSDNHSIGTMKEPFGDLVMTTTTLDQPDTGSPEDEDIDMDTGADTDLPADKPSEKKLPTDKNKKLPADENLPSDKDAPPTTPMTTTTTTKTANTKTTTKTTTKPTTTTKPATKSPTEEAMTEKTGVSTPIIVGSTLGACALVALISVGVFFLVKQQRPKPLFAAINDLDRAKTGDMMETEEDITITFPVSDYIAEARIESEPE